MVPAAEFRSYYGRPVVKVAPWEEREIAGYLFLGGLAASSALLAAGADLSERPQLRRTGRVGAVAAISLSLAALVKDLGRPARFINMLRVFKPTSPMSVGTWILTGFAPLAGVAVAGEFAAALPLPAAVRAVLRWGARPAGLGAAALAPAVASYTAVLLADTATPTWHAVHRELPFVFAGSAAVAGSGWALLTTPGDQAGPARRLAFGGAALDLTASRLMEARAGLAGEPLSQGSAGRKLKAAKALTATGALAATLSGLLGGRRGRLLGAASGAALLAGSALNRFGIFEAGIASAADPRYSVVPQRDRLAAADPVSGPT
jgi:hypothetical protein